MPLRVRGRRFIGSFLERRGQVSGSLHLCVGRGPQLLLALDRGRKRRLRRAIVGDGLAERLQFSGRRFRGQADGARRHAQLGLEPRHFPLGRPCAFESVLITFEEAPLRLESVAEPIHVGGTR